MEHLAVFVPSLVHPLLSTVYQCDGCLSHLGRGCSWLGCQVLPAISADSILSWLTIVVAPGCLGHPTSTVSDRATKLFTLVEFHSNDVALPLQGSGIWEFQLSTKRFKSAYT